MNAAAPRPLLILHLEDSPADARYIHDLLDSQGVEANIERVDGRQGLIAAMERSRFDLILCDYNLPDFDGLSAVRLIREKLPDTPLIVVSGSIDEEEAVKCLQLGATDYLLKQRMERFVPAVERALRESAEKRRRRMNESLLRLAGSFARLGGWAVDLPPERVELSDGACAIHEIPAGTSLPMADALSFYTSDSRPVIEDAFGKCARDGTPYDLELQILSASGRRLSVRTIGEAVRDDRGEIVRVHGAIQDITERKAMDARLLRSQRLESIGTLAGGIAHDLNNVLAPIVMGLDLLRQGPLEDGMRQIVRNIEKSARRGTNLVKQVLSFARGVEGARVTVHLGHVIKEVAGIARNTFPKNIELAIEIEDPLHLVTGDPTQLNQVLLNLCVNARDALPHGGRITISARDIAVDGQQAATRHAVPPGRYVLLQVEDTGMGIPREHLERIFDPFFTTKEQGKGTGLGLATSLGIVRSHGGHIHVSSESGQGARFEVYLPARDDSAGGDESGSAAPFLPPGRNECVLVVDDEDTIRTVTRQTLERHGYRVMTAEDGSQAIGLYALHRDDIAVVLTDMMMPVMDGATLIAALKRIEPGVRVVAASGLDSGDHATRAVKAGVRHFLPKPYSAETLLITIRDVLDDKRRL